MGGSAITSLLHRLAQPSQDGLWVPSQNASFLDKSIHTLFLHGQVSLLPSQNVSLLGKSFGRQVLRPVKKAMYLSPGCPMVFSTHTLEVIQCYSAAAWLGTWPVTEKSTVYW